MGVNIIQLLLFICFYKYFRYTCEIYTAYQASISLLSNSVNILSFLSEWLSPCENLDGQLELWNY